MDNGKKLMSVNEAAEMLGLGRSLVWSLVVSGSIRSLKIGRARRIPVHALDEFINRELEHQAVAVGVR